MPPPPRSRSCFLRGPCMLCFIVHSASPPAPEQPLPARDPLPPPPYAALATAEQRAARRLLCLPPAAWEPRSRCQRLLLSGLLPSPVRGLLGPARPPGEVASEMVCKRKGAGLPACPPSKQPRCAAAAEPEAGSAASGGDASARGAAGDSGGGGQPASPPPPPPALEEKEEEEKKEKERGGEAGCEEPQEHPGDGCREPLLALTPNINHLPPSILLKVGRDGRPRAGPAPGGTAGLPMECGSRRRWGCGGRPCPEGSFATSGPAWGRASSPAPPPAAAGGAGGWGGSGAARRRRCANSRPRSPGVWEMNGVVDVVFGFVSVGVFYLCSGLSL